MTENPRVGGSIESNRLDVDSHPSGRLIAFVCLDSLRESIRPWPPLQVPVSLHQSFSQIYDMREPTAVFGIDFTSAPSSRTLIACVRARFDRSALWLEELIHLQDFDSFSRLLATRATSGL